MDLIQNNVLDNCSISVTEFFSLIGTTFLLASYLLVLEPVLFRFRTVTESSGSVTGIVFKKLILLQNCYGFVTEQCSITLFWICYRTLFSLRDDIFTHQLPTGSRTCYFPF